eukprot:gene22254-29324_t
MQSARHGARAPCLPRYSVSTLRTALSTSLPYTPSSAQRTAISCRAITEVGESTSSTVPTSISISPDAVEILATPTWEEESTPFPINPVREPTPNVLELWQTADAVCFDVDCTIVKNDGLDLLAEFMGAGEQVEALTKQAMDGTMHLDTALEECLRILDCTPDDIKAFLKAHPPESRINEGVVQLVSSLKARGIEVYLISAEFREIISPIAKYLQIPSKNVIANRMNWQWDDETGEPTKLVGFDMSLPTSRNNGKPEAIAKLRQTFPYNTIVMVGDGVTDLEAVHEVDGADLFIGYGGNVQRRKVMQEADWFVIHFDELIKALKRRKVAMIGAGAMACAAMHVLSQNIESDDPAHLFDAQVKLWLHDSEFEGRLLSETVDETKENPKYMPGVYLGKGVVTETNLLECVRDADILVFCVPHQFIHGMCKKLIGKVKDDAIAISLTKGMRVRAEGPQLVSQMVKKMLGIDCSVLMGANIANEIGEEQLTEAVIGYYNRDNAKVFQKLFDREYFNITLIPDAPGAEMCGTLKNVVAIGAGLVDGLGYGSNSKAAIMRQGLAEMKRFSKALYPTIRDETILESCGVADLIATCYGGRNRRCAEKWAQLQVEGNPKTFTEIESELLGGQKLQGTLTTNEVYEIIEMRGWELEYPLFTTVYRIINDKIPALMIMNYKEAARVKLGPEPHSIAIALKKRRNPLPTVDV